MHPLLMIFGIVAALAVGVLVVMQQEQCTASSPKGPRIGDAILISGCP